MRVTASARTRITQVQENAVGRPHFGSVSGAADFVMELATSSCMHGHHDPGRRGHSRRCTHGARGSWRCFGSPGAAVAVPARVGGGRGRQQRQATAVCMQGRGAGVVCRGLGLWLGRRGGRVEGRAGAGTAGAAARHGSGGAMPGWDGAAAGGGVRIAALIRWPRAAAGVMLGTNQMQAVPPSALHSCEGGACCWRLIGPRSCVRFLCTQKFLSLVDAA